jgi:hypothetical protein
MKISAGLAAVAVSVMCLVGAGQAGAALEQRAGDPVVLKGSGLPDLVGAQPGQIVAFKRTGGQWVQVPVQVDERHTISVRQLYPEVDGHPYLGPATFDLEVYADEKTRSGADADATFDSDDELVFMGGDAGDDAPAGSEPPAGVDGASGVRVAVEDKVNGGSGAVYLFRSTGGLDPAAGKDYVDYEFKLTELGPGQTLLDDYGYVSSSNPEDSRVTTDNYELHSYDRWMEDEMKVKAGGASGVDILDREVAQATLIACVRSEYTFSGRWTEDSWAGNDAAADDEGTYVVVKDGPVRALRSFMGANSGPYVQREHIYYADHEANTIFLRVHAMPDLYSWTDYAPSAIGMTYRDVNNPGGVPVDGNPDELVPTTDVANGEYGWQQLSGAQGSVSSVVSAQTDIPNPSFGNYYLDDSTPTAPNETQCGGDGQSIGASGFGILGATPNTDPRFAVFNNLTVERTRFFGPPSDGVAEAEAYTSRVAQPLTGSAAASPITGPVPVSSPVKAKLKVRLAGKKRKARKGKAYRVRVRVKNTGKATARKVKVCVRSKALKRRGACRTLKALGAGKARTVTIRTRVKRNAKGKKLKLKLTARSGKAQAKKRVTVRYRR